MSVSDGPNGEATVIRKAATAALLVGALVVREPVERPTTQHRETATTVTATR